MSGEHLFFSIGVVATKIGVHPQTLREYERQGLVTPQRTAGGTRRYGQQELERLVSIQRLTAEGMSLAAVRYVLNLEDQIATANKLIEKLKLHLRQAGIDTPHQAPDIPQSTALTRSVSVELIHIPRTRRSPRWRNSEH